MDSGLRRNDAETRRGTATLPSRRALLPTSAASPARNHRPPDQDLLDLRGSLVEPEEPRVAVEVLDRVVRHVAGAAEALAPTDQRARRHAAILEHDVGGKRAALAHLLVDLADAESGRPRLDEEGRDAAGAFVPGIAARHHGEDAGDRRVGDEALAAV